MGQAPVEGLLRTLGTGYLALKAGLEAMAHLTCVGHAEGEIKEILERFRELGVGLSCDDFGTGYSSLSALQQFPIGALKIDQSFVRDATTDRNDATIVRTIIEMGRSLGLQVLAEGIETEEQRHFLVHSGCQFGQGRLFGEPMTSADFLDTILRQATGEHPILRLPA